MRRRRRTPAHARIDAEHGRAASPRARPSRRRSATPSRASAPSSKFRPRSRPTSHAEADAVAHAARSATAAPRRATGSTRATSRSSRSIPPGASTSTRRFTPSAEPARAFACTTRSPTSPRSSRRAARSIGNRSFAASRCTCPTAGRRCSRVLGEGAASLLPARTDRRSCGRSTSTPTAPPTRRGSSARRCAAALALDFDESAEPRSTPAPPRSRLALLREIGSPRVATSKPQRGGDQPRSPRAGGRAAAERRVHARVRAPLPVETWNAQISLLAGMEAAKMMIGAHVGILRTLPPPQSCADRPRLRRSAGALAHRLAEGDVVGRARQPARSQPATRRRLSDSGGPRARAVPATRSSTRATRAPHPQLPIHAGVAAPYAHVTAPLRRLGDRYANEIVLAATAGTTPPDWATANLEAVATAMRSANRHSAQIERAVIDAVECVLLLPRVGATFEAVVVDRNEHGAIVQLTQPTVLSRRWRPTPRSAAPHRPSRIRRSRRRVIWCSNPRDTLVPNARGLAAAGTE